MNRRAAVVWPRKQAMNPLQNALSDARRRFLENGPRARVGEYMNVYSTIYNECIHDRTPDKEKFAALHSLFRKETTALCDGAAALPLPRMTAAYDAGTRFLLFSFRYLDRFYTRRRERPLEEQAREICASILFPRLLAETRALLCSRPQDGAEDTVLRAIAWSLRHGFSTAPLAGDLVTVFEARLSAMPAFRDIDGLLAHRAGLLAEARGSRLVTVLDLRGTIEGMVSAACCRDEALLVSGMRSFLRARDTNRAQELLSFARAVLPPAFRAYVSEVLGEGVRVLYDLRDLLGVVHEDYTMAFHEAVRAREGFVAETVGWYRADPRHSFLVSLFPQKTEWFACYEKSVYRALMDESATVEKETERLTPLVPEMDRRTSERLRLLLHDFAESGRYGDTTTDRLIVLSNPVPYDPLRNEPLRPWDAWLMPEILRYFRGTDAAYREKKKRRLVFSLWNSTAEITIRDGETGRTAVLAAIQLAFLYLVVYHQRDTAERIAESTGIDPGIAGGVLHSLTRGPSPVLRRSGDVFEYHACPDGRVYAPRLPAAVRAARKQAAAPSEASHRLRAAIVHVMKRERELTEAELRLRFPRETVADLKKQVSLLVEQDYLAQEEENLCYVP